MVSKEKCPVCAGEDITGLYSIAVPVLQNRVYEDREEARHSASGTVLLSQCASCDFVFNAGFDESIIVYDEFYDNSVPSPIFKQYYKSIAAYLYNKYNLAGKFVYDIGCGKGTFLQILCNDFPDVSGVGIDPSYEGDEDPQPNLHFIKDFFHESQIEKAPDLVLSRHVFEHIEHPTAFLQIIQDALKKFKDVPFFIEIPDFEWIINNKTFWDICYEHCNYFSGRSLSNMFRLGGAALQSITPAFDNQYLWAEGLLNATTPAAPEEFTPLRKELIADFISSIKSMKAGFREKVDRYRSEGYKVVIWGMATKGVIFSNIVDGEHTLVDYCIDLNTAKQEKFTPLTGHRIQAPSALAAEKGSRLVVIVMNTIYAQEIMAEARSWCDHCVFIDAHGNPL